MSLTTIAVSDPLDERLTDYTRLTDVALRSRREPAEGLFMAESVNVMGRAVAAEYQVRSVLTDPKWLPEVEAVLGSGSAVPVYVGGPAVIAATTGFRMHRGPMAAMARKPLPPVSDVVAGARLAVVLDGLVDHTNVGAAFRSAAAMGAGAVLVTQQCADPLYRRSVRVSMGTVFQVPWTRLAPGQGIAGFTTVALTPDPGAEELSRVAARIDARIALVVGTEGPGLGRHEMARADHTARIPMAADVDSLNVAAAVAVACHICRPR